MSKKFEFKFVEQRRAKSHLQVAKTMIKTYNTHRTKMLKP